MSKYWRVGRTQRLMSVVVVLLVGSTVVIGGAGRGRVEAVDGSGVIVYVSAGQIWSTPADGSASPIALTDGPEDSFPAISPSEDTVVFSRGGDLWTVSLAGGPATQLTNTPSENERSPEWSPDGSRIVHDDNSSSLGIVAYPSGAVVSTFDIAGQQLRPTWSITDGRLVAFISTHGGNRQIYTVVLEPDGTFPPPGTEALVPPPAAGREFTEPNFGPGDRLVAAEIGTGLWTLDTDGSNAVRIPGESGSANFSPTGASVVYASGASSELMVTDLTAGAIPVTLLSAGGPVSAPDWTSVPPPTSGSGCAAGFDDAIGWWSGEDDLTARVGPDLAGGAAFADAVVGRGMVLDGALDTSALPIVSDAVTIEMWIRPNETGRVLALASRWDFPSTDDAARSYNLLLLPSSGLTFETDESSTRRPEVLQAAAPTVFDGSFHHIAATWDRSVMRIYLDGVEIASKTSQGGTMNPATTVPFLLGGQTGSGFGFSGVIDEAAVYDRVLGASEIAAIHSAGSDGKCLVATSPPFQLVPADSAAGDLLGSKVAVDGDIVAIAAISDDGPARTDQGSVRIVTRSSGSWAEELTVFESPSLSTQFGVDVALSGETLVVGNNLASGGRAFVHTRTGATWPLQQTLSISDPANTGNFGWSVDIDGDTAVIGSLGLTSTEVGAAYVYTRLNGVWSLQQKLTGLDVVVGDRFAEDVAVDGDVVVIGSVDDDDGGSESGSAYVFERSGATWTQTAKLTASDGAAGDNFGRSVDVDDGTVVVGAWRDDSNRGAAYVYANSGGGWTERAKLTASDGGGPDFFGGSVAIRDDAIVVGAGGTFGGRIGAAYRFQRNVEVWTEVEKLQPTAAAAGDAVGAAVAVSTDTIVLGAPGSDVQGTDSGTAYILPR